jgi:surface antigen
MWTGQRKFEQTINNGQARPMGKPQVRNLGYIISGRKKIARLTVFSLLLMGAFFLFPTKSEANWPMAGCQCTDFVYSQRPDIPNTMGRARDFLYSSRINRFPYDQVPQVGDVAVFLMGEFGFSARLGHVALVIDVNQAMDRFSIVGWNGLKADCILEITFDLPVTNNTYFIHHKEPVNFQTLSLEEWTEIADEQAPRRFDVGGTCNHTENDSTLNEPGCPEDLGCCEATESSIEAASFQMTQDALSRHLKYLNFP